MATKTSALPSYLTQNLRFPARPYQQAALQRWLNYLADKPDLPIQLLFNLATGAGKTYLMAALMLDLYRRGRRNFIFFVNSTNILEKTRDNFIHSGSSKYLFASQVMVDGRHVSIREIKQLSESDPDAINIIFTTTQRLHADLNHPKENRLTFAELRQYDLVLIGDEAHHNNVSSARTTGADNENWETTVDKIIRQNSRTILLEFTATMNFDDAAIRQKYAERTLFQYDLRAFRRDGYSKDVMLYIVDDVLWKRELAAIIISEYRQYLALSHQINLKPIVLFKSRTIYDNKSNLDDFKRLLLDLSPAQLEELRNESSTLLARAFEFFSKLGWDLKRLCSELQHDFGFEHLLRMDGGQSISTVMQHAVNTLESPSNPFRAIFAVDMLKEGWDVLNLFDIVRLYDVADGKYQGEVYLPGKTTISEAQLIGRGARYFPFDVPNYADNARRKFDNDSDNELRLLEQLHYHTKHNVRYIDELKTALDQTGITDFAKLEAPVKHHQSVVKITTLSNQPKLKIPTIFRVFLPSQRVIETQLFSESLDIPVDCTSQSYKIGEIFPTNLMYAAMNRNASYNFCNLVRYGYKSREEFMNELKQCTVEVHMQSLTPQFSPQQKMHLMMQILSLVHPEGLEPTT